MEARQLTFPNVSAIARARSLGDLLTRASGKVMIIDWPAVI